LKTAKVTGSREKPWQCQKWNAPKINDVLYLAMAVARAKTPTPGKRLPFRI
jgi:hypothetical protein